MRVLLLGYETEGCSLAYLSELLEADGHDAILAHCDYYIFIDDNHIKKFYRQRGFTGYVTFEDEYKTLYDKEWNVDWEYLESFERLLTKSKNLQQLVLTDPILSRNHHFRYPYLTPLESREQVFYWAERLIRWTIDVIESYEPDVVLTYGRNYFVKNVVAQIAASTELPMFTLLRSRIGGYCHLTRNFGLGTDPDLVDKLDDPANWPDINEAKEYVSSFRASTDEGGLYDARSQRRIVDKELFSFSEIISDFARNTGKIALKSLLRNKRKYNGRVFATNYFNSHTPSVLGFHARIAYNSLRYLWEDLFTRTVPDRPFVYVPLHTLPESSTLTLSTEYYEADLVRFMAKELPASIDIAVKENPNMIGTRPFSYYEALAKIPNVHLIDPTVQSKRLIREARGVCGISGTALLEAAILDTPTHHFGCPEFDAVLDYKGHDEFSQFASACADGRASRHSERVERYIQYVVNEGREIPITCVRTDPGSRSWEKGTRAVYELFEPRATEALS